MGMGLQTSEAALDGSGQTLRNEVESYSTHEAPGAPADAQDIAAAVLAAAAAAAARGALPEALSHPVPHLQQAYNWDCGLACVLMVLRTLGMQHHHMASLLQLCPTRSIWTIDLAHLLAACGARVQMLTVTLGANQAYSGERFYAETMQDDSRRVERLFRTAAAAGISVCKRSLPLSHLRSLLLTGSCLLVALVDKVTLASPSLPTHSSGGLGSRWSTGGVRRSGRLVVTAPQAQGACSSYGSSDGSSSQSGGGVTERGHEAGEAAEGGGGTLPLQHGAAPAATSGDGADVAVVAGAGAGAGSGTAAGAARHAAAGQAQGQAALPAAASAASAPHAAAGAAAAGGYLGHYIVLCGYDARSDEFELRDPASDRCHLWIPAAQLEAARLCFGTDEDLLLIQAGPPSPAQGAAAAAVQAAAVQAAPGEGAAGGGTAAAVQAAPADAATAAQEGRAGEAGVPHRQQQPGIGAPGTARIVYG